MIESMLDIIKQTTLIIAIFVFVEYLSLNKMFSGSFSLVNKLKKNKFFYKLEVSIKDYLSKLKKQYKISIKIKVIVILSITLFLIGYTTCFFIFKLHITALVLSIPIIFIPASILKAIVEREDLKIEKNLLNLIIQLKNETKHNNNIVQAINNIKTMKPLSIYIEQFNASINSGQSIYRSFENLRNSFKQNRVKQLIKCLEVCNLNGGSYFNLLSKYQELIIKIQGEKEKREQDTFYAKMILYAMIGIDVFFLLQYVIFNRKYFEVITSTNIGIVILNINFLTIWLMVYIAKYVKKLDY